MTKKKNLVFCDPANDKMDSPEDLFRVLFKFHSDRVLFKFHSDMVLFRFYSDRVLFFRVLSNRFFF